MEQIFPRCGECPERKKTHMLLCKEARVLWRMSPARLELKDWLLSFVEWCENFASMCKLDIAYEMIMMLIWQIWNVRNEWVFERKTTDPPDFVRPEMRLSGDYEAARKRDEGASRSTGRIATH